MPLSPWSPVEARAEIPAPPEEVFDVLSNTRTYPEWLVGAQRIRAVDPEFPAPGAEFHHSVGPSEAVTVDDSSEVLEVLPPYRLELQVHVGPLRGIVDFLVAPTGGGSEVRFRERPAGRARVLLPVLRPFLHARNARSLHQLTEYLALPAATAPGP